MRGIMPLLPYTSLWHRYSITDRTVYLGLFPPGDWTGFLKQNTQVHVMSRLRMRGVMPLLPYTSLWHRYSITDRTVYRSLFSRGVGTGFLKLNTHMHVMPSLRMRGVMPLLPYTSLWHRYSITDRTVYVGPFPPGDGTGFLRLNTQVHVMPRLRMRGDVHLLPHTSS
jgi:hypothetical protein